MRTWPLLLLAAIVIAPPARAQHVPADDLAPVEAALRSGRFWHATELLQPLLDQPDHRPAVTIAAARAAAGWEGWRTVRRLLSNKSWIDSRFDRLGRLLLAEAALGLGQPNEAVRQAKLSLDSTLLPRTDANDARRWISLARAQEQLHAWDDAAEAYTLAAAHLPAISDWLALRAAGVSRDSATRQRLYSIVTIAAARARIDWTEALALVRFDRKADAAELYAKLGDRARALQLRWEASNNGSNERPGIVAGLVDVATNDSDRDQRRRAIATIADYRVGLTVADSFAVATAAATVGYNGSAREMFNSLARHHVLSAEQWLKLGDAESALGKWTAAQRSYAVIRSGPLAGRAAYQRARAELRQGRVGAASRRLTEIATRYPKDQFAAGTALYLLADLALDAGRPDSARKLLIRLASTYPENEFAPRAVLLAPLIDYARGRQQSARDELAAATESGRLSGLDADAVNYWLARSLIATGASREGAVMLRRLLDRGPENYYAIRAAARLDSMPWQLPAAATVASKSLPQGAARAELLEHLGLDLEAEFERRQLVADASTPVEIMNAATALLTLGHPSEAAVLSARLARSNGHADGDSWRLKYLLPYRAELLKSAQAAELDPWLVAAVIRQESGFNPRARSGADARGLMQLLPGSGRDLARSIGLRHYDSAVLWQPGINLAMGTRHLARELRRYPELERSLAAYNAGPGKVNQWSQTLLNGTVAGDSGLADPELFVERIPYRETRNYIRRITVNRMMYGLLYGE